mmetsp:Transcript_24701/g.48453  ORF Transcript_24701/g.48453 Transcript_24701/m.48453 type:complete len:105 (+) Transcript_24701:1480-1794(+)
MKGTIRVCRQLQAEERKQSAPLEATPSDLLNAFMAGSKVEKRRAEKRRGRKPRQRTAGRKVRKVCQREETKEGMKRERVNDREGEEKRQGPTSQLSPFRFCSFS